MGRSHPRRLVKQIGIQVEVATKIKHILDFTEEPKDVSIEAVVKSFHKISDAQQEIRDALKEFDIDVIIIDDDAVYANFTLEYLQDRQKLDEDTLAYVRLYINDEEQNTSWLKCDFPCPVVFDFCKTKAENQTTNNKVIAKACNEEFGFRAAIVQKRIAKLNHYLESYSSYLQELISICSNAEHINRCVVESFDDNATEDKLFSFARSVWLDGNPNTPRPLSNAFTVNDHKSKLVHEILKDLCEKISCSILTKLSNYIKKQINTTAFDAVRSDVANNQVGYIHRKSIFVWIYDLLLAEIRIAISIVVTYFIPMDVNSDRWRKGIVTMTHKSLLVHRMAILNELNKQYQKIYQCITYQLKRELQETSNHLLPYSAKGYSGCKLTSASYGTDKFGRKVIGLRAENFDHIHLTYEKGMDIFFDQKTIKESTSEMQLVDAYMDFQLVENVRIRFELRRYLNQIVRKHTPELMKKHSNLITISTSPVTSHRGGIEKAACIVLYCSCKGIIPLGEPTFPRELDNIPVDVREGYIYFATAREFHDPLRLGCSIGVSGESKAGSIGVFVKEVATTDQYGLLTCGHVLLPGQELTDPHIRQKIRDSIVSIDVVQPSYMDDRSNITCGRLIDAKFGNVIYNGNFTGVDYAYVRMTCRIPRVLKFPTVEWEHTEASMKDGYIEEMKMGLPILDMDENDTKHDVCKFGRTSGFTKGVFDFSGAAIRKDTLSAPLCQGEEDRHLYNLYNIKSLGRPFCDLGDSGASVFIQKESGARVIGLAVGGLINGRECFVTPIGAVLDSIEPRIEIQCFPN
ncbi:hypothetical protein KP79_PYT18586 [Mizuhopecten yessoensis]|uniref:Uncharacterized protein n=1 Tax=Mizuhopecten yessoensis TaxID=6573 RepID=A0A210PYV2_MIZYE|nr:hypothetical protein KP79_PYT18586 [Mizuhopecten yessoensis]